MGEREMVAMRWGMVPHFAKSLADFKGYSTINAKAETLTTQAMWRVPFQRRRCLVPADGFYEWKALDTKTKQPYAFTIRSGEPFAFAERFVSGVWDPDRRQISGTVKNRELFGVAPVGLDPLSWLAWGHRRRRVLESAAGVKPCGVKRNHCRQYVSESSRPTVRLESFADQERRLETDSPQIPPQSTESGSQNN
jgi:putative SOS response-associated peptidase YedK